MYTTPLNFPSDWRFCHQNLFIIKFLIINVVHAGISTEISFQFLWNVQIINILTLSLFLYIITSTQNKTSLFSSSSTFHSTFKFSTQEHHEQEGILFNFQLATHSFHILPFTVIHTTIHTLCTHKRCRCLQRFCLVCVLNRIINLFSFPSLLLLWLFSL